MCSSQKKKESIEVGSGWGNISHRERRKHGTTMSDSRCCAEHRASSHHKPDDAASWRPTNKFQLSHFIFRERYGTLEGRHFYKGRVREYLYLLAQLPPKYLD